MLQPSPSDPNPAEASEVRAQRAKVEPPKFDFDPSLQAGAKLAAARRQLGLSLEEVAERIRVRKEFLEALEAMNFKLLPGKAYAMAFLRSYAKVLGLDEQAIVEQFQDESALSRQDAHKQIRNPNSKPHPERPWLAAAAVVLAAAGFVGWKSLQHDVVVAAPATHRDPLVPTQIAAGPAAATEDRVIEIKALSESWLEARGPDGTVFLSRNLEPGDVYRPDPSPGWTLHARDGGAFEVYLNGTSVGLLGVAGMPVLGRPIDGIQPVAQASIQAPRSR